jgi:hypothetical protein
MLQYKLINQSILQSLSKAHLISRSASMIVPIKENALKENVNVIKVLWEEIVESKQRNYMKKFH